MTFQQFLNIPNPTAETQGLVTEKVKIAKHKHKTGLSNDEVAILSVLCDYDNNNSMHRNYWEDFKDSDPVGFNNAITAD